MQDLLAEDNTCVYLKAQAAAEASGAGEPPPCALSEPGVSLSTHRAPIIQPKAVVSASEGIAAAVVPLLPLTSVSL